MEPPSTPWWQRFEQTAERTSTSSRDAGCATRVLDLIECKPEKGPDGEVTRQCQRLMRKFRTCPGRPAEEIETAVSKTDMQDSEFLRLPEMPPLGQRQHEAGLHQNVGEVFDELFKIAEELQAALVEDGGAVPAEAQQQQGGGGGGGFMSRVFRRQRRQQDGDGKGGGSAKAPWQGYEKSFEET